MSNATEPLRGCVVGWWKESKKTRIKRLKYRLLILADSHNSKIDTDILKKKAHKKKIP